MVDKTALMKVLNRRVQVPGYFKQNYQQQMIDYVSKFTQGDKGQIDYREMVEDVQRFDYMADATQPRSGASQKSAIVNSVVWNEPKSIFEDDYVVLDQKKVPQNTIEGIERKLVKINRKLRKQFTE